MAGSVIRNFLQSPLKYPLLVFRKLFIYPFRYRKGEGYQAARYWDERLKKYGTGLKGVGEEGRSEADNQKRYERVCGVFREVCKSVMQQPASVRVLEIGCGTGRMTRVLYDLGVQQYRGIDITDALFPELERAFHDRAYTFHRADLTRDFIEGSYDVVVIIDVIEHIVEDERFRFGMENLKRVLVPGGRLIIAPLVAQNKKIQFYERHWSKADLEAHFEGWRASDLRVWEPGFSEIAVFEKPAG
jgi:SAM-dependent methyltransferase